MPDPSYSPEAERLAKEWWERTFAASGTYGPYDCLTTGAQAAARFAAQSLIDAGWTPPPDPHDEIARELYDTVCEHMGWTETTPSGLKDALLAAVKRMGLHREDGTDG